MKIDFVDASDMSNTEDNDETKNNVENNDGNKICRPPNGMYNEKNLLPLCEGNLPIAFSRGKLEYHICKCYSGSREEKEFIDIALRTCKIACIATDISRGRPISPTMAQLLTKKCITKLNNMWKVVTDNNVPNKAHKNHPISCSMPPIPDFINGVYVNPKHFESVVRITAGPKKYWLSLVLELRQNKWICTYADLG